MSMHELTVSVCLLALLTGPFQDSGQRPPGTKVLPTLPSYADRPAALLGDNDRFAVARFTVRKATLKAACLELTRVSGVTVSAEGTAATPINLSMEETSFWHVVLAICHQGQVGLAPNRRPGKENAEGNSAESRASGPGSVPESVVLGAGFPRPEHAYVDGPVLVQLTAKALPGERAGLLHTALRTVPGLPLLAATEPRFTGDKDWEG